MAKGITKVKTSIYMGVFLIYETFSSFKRK